MVKSDQARLMPSPLVWIAAVLAGFVRALGLARSSDITVRELNLAEAGMQMAREGSYEIGDGSAFTYPLTVVGLDAFIFRIGGLPTDLVAAVDRARILSAVLVGLMVIGVWVLARAAGAGLWSYAAVGLVLFEPSLTDAAAHHRPILLATVLVLAGHGAVVTSLTHKGYLTARTAVTAGVLYGLGAMTVPVAALGGVPAVMLTATRRSTVAWKTVARMIAAAVASYLIWPIAALASSGSDAIGAGEDRAIPSVLDVGSGAAQALIVAILLIGIWATATMRPLRSTSATLVMMWVGVTVVAAVVAVVVDEGVAAAVSQAVVAVGVGTAVATQRVVEQVRLREVGRVVVALGVVVLTLVGFFDWVGTQSERDDTVRQAAAAAQQLRNLGLVTVGDPATAKVLGSDVVLVESTADLQNPADWRARYAILSSRELDGLGGISQSALDDFVARSELVFEAESRTPGDLVIVDLARLSDDPIPVPVSPTTTTTQPPTTTTTTTLPPTTRRTTTTTSTIPPTTTTLPPTTLPPPTTTIVRTTTTVTPTTTIAPTTTRATTTTVAPTTTRAPTTTEVQGPVSPGVPDDDEGITGNGDDDENPQKPSESTYEVVSGDSFWHIAFHVLEDELDRSPTNAEIVPFWLDLIEANEDRLPQPGNADLIFPGMTLIVPPLT